MTNIELLLLSIGLAMDAFAVSIGKGLSLTTVKPRQMATVGLWFGGFQAMMPLVGFLAGSLFANLVDKYDHWITFILLALIGGNMIREAFSENQEEDSGSLKAGEMFILAVATSIDALAVGVSLAFVGANIAVSAATIGIVCCIISIIGLQIGSRFGKKNRKIAEIIGGVLLVCLGLRILITGLMG